jgi:hypothetical protein
MLRESGSKNHMKVPCGEEIPFSSFKPSLFVQGLALGAMAIAAGVVGDPQGMAVVTLIDMSPKLSRSGDLDGPHGTVMPQGHLMGLAIGQSVGPKDIGHLKGAFHQKPTSSNGRRS